MVSGDYGKYTWRGIPETQLYSRSLLDMEGLTNIHVTDILDQSDGFVWVGTRDGLFRFDCYSFQPVLLLKQHQFMEGSKVPWVVRLCQLRDKRILINYRPVKYDPEVNTKEIFNPITGQTETLELMDKDNYNSIHAIHEASENEFRIGIRGVNILKQKTNMVKAINEQNGLPKQSIAGILPDSNR